MQQSDVEAIANAATLSENLIQCFRKHEDSDCEFQSKMNYLVVFA